MKNRALDLNRNLEIRYVSYTYTCTILWTKHLKMDLANVYICTCRLQGLQSIIILCKRNASNVARERNRIVNVC